MIKGSTLHLGALMSCETIQTILIMSIVTRCVKITVSVQATTCQYVVSYHSNPFRTPNTSRIVSHDEWIHSVESTSCGVITD